MNGSDWALLNCSPDIREQIANTPALQPLSQFSFSDHPGESRNGGKERVRHSPVKSVILTNADIDHIGGLLSLRESQSFDVWATAEVLRQLRDNPVFNALNPEFVRFLEFSAGTSFAPLPGLSIEAFEVPGKVPLYREAKEGFSVGRHGNTKGLHVSGKKMRLSYVPGCGAVDPQLLIDLTATDVLLFDGTLWTDDEMIVSGTGSKTGRRMGHVPVSGPDGSMALLKSMKAKRRIFVHMNNTNPLLIDGSPERLEAEADGWAVSFDGMEIVP